MDLTTFLKAFQDIYTCLAAQYPNLKTIGQGVAEIVGGATLIFRASQTQSAGILNSLLPPALQSVMKALGSGVEKAALNLK